MAVKYKELKEKLEAEPLTLQELKYIDAAEKYIDDELTRRFDNSEIRIEMNVFDFNSIPKHTPMINDIKNTRKVIMRKELEKRFKDAGWDIKDDPWDGHSSGTDYVILSGKK